MQNGSSSEGKLYGLVGVGVLVVLGVVWMGWSVPRSAAGVGGSTAAGVAGEWPAAQQAVEFADHGQLEVFGTGVGEYTVERLQVARQLGLLERLRNHFGHASFSVSSSGHSVANFLGGGGRYQIETSSENQDGEMRMCRVAVAELQPLMLELRLLDPAGSPVLQEHCHSLGKVMKTLGFGDESGELGPVGETAAERRAALGAAGLGVLVQHKDPVSGWVNLDGPYRTEAELAGRGVFMLFGWQRDQVDLKFRAIRADGEVVEFTLPNPDFRKEPYAQPAPLGLPARLEWDGFAVELGKLRRVARPDSQPFTACQVMLLPGQLGADPQNLLERETRFIADEWGNRVPLVLLERPHGWEEGFMLPGGSRRANLTVSISKTPWYPRREDECGMLAEGVVSADGKRVDFTLLPGAGDLGLSAAPVGDVAEPDPSLAAESRDQLDVRLDVTLTGKALARVVASYGEVSTWLPAFFVDGEAKSGGMAQHASTSMETSPSRTHAELQFRWSCPEGTLRPGARIRVGIIAALAAGELVFPVEMPEVKKEER